MKQKGQVATNERKVQSADELRRATIPEGMIDPFAAQQYPMTLPNLMEDVIPHDIAMLIAAFLSLFRPSAAPRSRLCSQTVILQIA